MLKLRIPASSGNLGPGFDTFALALGKYLTVSAGISDGGKSTISVTGVDTESIPQDETNIIIQMYRYVCEKYSQNPFPMDLLIGNDIPLKRGMGSSAAALLAGVLIANHLHKMNLDYNTLISLCAEKEGHADNISASLRGGMTVVMRVSENGFVHETVHLPDTLDAAIVLPDLYLPTVQARAVIPESFKREDTVYNLQHAAYLFTSLTKGNLCRLAESVGDRLHQPYRSNLIPGLKQILELNRIYPNSAVTLSGAGPSILVLSENDSGIIVEKIIEIFQKNDISAETIPAGIDNQGYKVVNGD